MPSLNHGCRQLTLVINTFVMTTAYPILAHPCLNVWSNSISHNWSKKARIYLRGRAQKRHCWWSISSSMDGDSVWARASMTNMMDVGPRKLGGIDLQVLKCYLAFPWPQHTLRNSCHLQHLPVWIQQVTGILKRLRHYPPQHPKAPNLVVSNSKCFEMHWRHQGVKRCPQLFQATGTRCLRV